MHALPTLLPPASPGPLAARLLLDPSPPDRPGLRSRMPLPSSPAATLKRESRSGSSLRGSRPPPQRVLQAGGLHDNYTNYMPAPNDPLMYSVSTPRT